MSIYGWQCKANLKVIRYLFKTAAITNIYERLFTSFNRTLELQNNYVYWDKRIHEYSTKNRIEEGKDGRIQNLKKTSKQAVEDLFENDQLRIQALRNIIECNEQTATDIFLKFPFLKTSNLKLLQPKYTTLIEAGVPKEELMNDMWILSYSLVKLKERLEVVKSMNFSPMKPWHLRCKKEVLFRLSQNKENNRLALSPYQSVSDYICERLGITETQVLSFAKRHPAVMRVKVAKLKEVIDFLFSEGFTANQIYNTPRILCHSLKTIQKRLSVLRALNHEPYSLFILCKSQRKFSEFVMSLESSGPVKKYLWMELLSFLERLQDAK